MFVKKVKLEKWGNSYGIRIGKDEPNQLALNRKDITFEMTKEGPETLEELFADYMGETIPKEDRFNWGQSVGKELI